MGPFNPQRKIQNVTFNQAKAFFRFWLADRQSSLGLTLQRIEVVQLTPSNFRPAGSMSRGIAKSIIKSGGGSNTYAPGTKKGMLARSE